MILACGCVWSFRNKTYALQYADFEWVPTLTQREDVRRCITIIFVIFLHKFLTPLSFVLVSCWIWIISDFDETWSCLLLCVDIVIFHKASMSLSTIWWIWIIPHFLTSHANFWYKFLTSLPFVLVLCLALCWLWMLT